MTLSCQRHCRGTVQNLKKTKKNKQKTTEVPTVSRCGETTVILCSTITITNHCQTTTEKVVFRSQRNVVSDSAFLTDDGRLYHARAEAIRKARSPSVECLEVQELHSVASYGTNCLTASWRRPADAVRSTVIMVVCMAIGSLRGLHLVKKMTLPVVSTFECRGVWISTGVSSVVVIGARPVQQFFSSPSFRRSSLVAGRDFNTHRSCQVCAGFRLIFLLTMLWYWHSHNS